MAWDFADFRSLGHCAFDRRMFRILAVSLHEEIHLDEKDSCEEGFLFHPVLHLSHGRRAHDAFGLEGDSRN
jgi:hypothetical protein